MRIKHGAHDIAGAKVRLALLFFPSFSIRFAGFSPRIESEFVHSSSLRRFTERARCVKVINMYNFSYLQARARDRLPAYIRVCAY